MGRFRNAATGVTVSVADGSHPGIGWEPADEAPRQDNIAGRPTADEDPAPKPAAKKAPAKRTTKRKAAPVAERDS